jgi:hypothetical protein
MENLSSEQLESKVNVLNNTVITLKLALTSVNCEKAKSILQVQIDTYNESIKKLLFELSKRPNGYISERAAISI